MKLIKRDDNKPAPKLSALQRAKRQLAAKKEAAQKALPAGEYFTEEFRCSATGLDFAIVWYREHAGELFRVREIITSQNQPGNQASAQASTGAREYPLSAFDTSGRICPHCQHQDGVVYCHCGRTLCASGIYVTAGARHIRVRGCCDREIGGTRSHARGSAEALEQCALGKSPKGRKQITGPQRPRLAHDKKPLLPRS